MYKAAPEMRTSRTLEAVTGCHGFANFYFTHSAVDQHCVKIEGMQLSMRVIALRFVSSITDSVHCTSYCKFSSKTVNILESTLASSVPPAELVSCVVHAWTTLAWQLDLLDALNIQTIIT